MLIVGYLVYWIELYVFKANPGYTTILATSIFSVIVILSLLKIFKKNNSVPEKFHDGKILSLFDKIFIRLSIILILLILAIGLYASFFPPHLPQEYDVINYHITMPRQHLLRGDFSLIKWATADLYFSPVDYALAPYWLATRLPNKVPQFIFLLGLLGVSLSFVRRNTNNNVMRMAIISAAIIGSHNIGIQAGTAMLDIVMCYLVISALDSFQKGNMFLGSIEACFYFWSKSFIPIQTLIIGVLMFILFYILKVFHYKLVPVVENNKEEFLKKVKISIMYFLFFSVFIGGPFLAKSFIYANTPMFPFALGSVDLGNINYDSVYWGSLKRNADLALATKDQYGSGRSLLDFLKHFWLIAVPEKGVNNRYDYPVGLMYLLFLGPFLVETFRSLKRREFQILSFFIITFWATWWMGSHQSRFLFVPIILMFIYVVLNFQFKSRVFFIGVILSMFLVLLSVYRANKRDFGRSRFDVLRHEDKRLVELSKTVDRSDTVVLDSPDVAFADFKVDVKGVDSVFVIKHE